MYLHYVLHGDHAILREGAVVTALAIFCNSYGYTIILEAFVFYLFTCIKMEPETNQGRTKYVPTSHRFSVVNTQ